MTSLCRITKPACDALHELMANAFLECASDDPVLALLIKAVLEFKNMELYVQVWGYYVVSRRTEDIVRVQRIQHPETTHWIIHGVYM